MNFRDYKLNFTGGIFHDFNRGVNKQDIFIDKQDYARFFILIREAFLGEPGKKSKRKTFPAGSFAILAYVLMPNHFHFVIQQLGTIPVGEALKKIQGGYVKYFNARHERTGGLFADQFKQINIDTDSYLKWVMAYVLLNPKTAGLEKELGDYPYSSLPDLLGKRNGNLTHTQYVLDLFGGKEKLKEFLDMAAVEIKKRKDLENYLLDHTS